jgi:hypothetical protein
VKARLVEIVDLSLFPALVASPFLFPVLSLETASFSQVRRSALLVPFEEAIYFYEMENQGVG